MPVDITESVMLEVGKLQEDYAKLRNSGKMTKKAICDLVIPFRDKYGLLDGKALQIARGELTIMGVYNALIKGKAIENKEDN